MTNSATVMVVDDERDIQQLYAINLQRLGYAVIPAYSGNEAIERYRELFVAGRPVDVVLLDLNLPGGLSGKEIAAAIRTVHRGAKIVVSSGSTQSPEMMDYRDFGFDGALEKNFNRAAIQQVLAQVLASGNR